MARFIAAFAAAAALAMTGTASAGSAISNDMSRCSAGRGPAVKVVVQGVKSSTGKMRVQSYPATKAAWLTKGRWLQRIETGARAILVSSIYGHGEIDCDGLRGRCIERGLDRILLYVGGNLVIGKREFAEVETLFKGMGYVRVFAPSVDLAAVAQLLKQDIAAQA